MTLPAPPRRSLILGGVKSGKSNHAERLAESYSETSTDTVVLIATATAEDDEMQKRIERHQKVRNPGWMVIEEPVHLALALRQADREKTDPGGHHCIVIDCLTLWVTNLLMQTDETLLRQEVDDFQQSVIACQSRLIMVSNETNLGITPMGELSRRFCDEIGLLHQALGHTCDHVAMMVAGIAVNIKNKCLER